MNEQINEDYGFYIDVFYPEDTGIPYTIVVNAHMAYDDQLGPRIRVLPDLVTFPGFGEGAPVFFDNNGCTDPATDPQIQRIISNNLEILLNFWESDYETGIDSIEFGKRFIK